MQRERSYSFQNCQRLQITQVPVQGVTRVFRNEYVSPQNWPHIFVMNSFYKGESESIELLSTECDFSNRFWQDLIINKWFITIGIKIGGSIRRWKFFSLWNKQTNFHLLKLYLILSKQQIYTCRSKEFLPSLKIYLAKVG